MAKGAKKLKRAANAEMEAVATVAAYLPADPYGPPDGYLAFEGEDGVKSRMAYRAKPPPANLGGKQAAADTSQTLEANDVPF